MSDLIWQGLTISVMGLGFTFVALALLILTMVLLERFSRNSVQSLVPDEAASDKVVGVSAPAQDTEEEIAAAIAVALIHLRSTSDSVHHNGLGTMLEAGRGPWWIAGRTQQRSTNTSRRIQWRN